MSPNHARRRPARPLASSEVTGWADEADVVVVGYGVAGASAAVAAAAQTDDVLVIERTSGWGGAAAMAGGFIYLGGGTSLQKACGFDDTPEDMHTFLAAAMGSGANADKIAVYSEHSVGHFDWLVSCGVPFRAAFFGKPAWEPGADEGLMYSGGENAYPFADLVRPAPRGHLPQMQNKRTGERGGGYMLMEPLTRTAAESGVRLRQDTRFERLVIESDGHVSGVVATSYGEQVVIRARRGVVLASGGYAFSPRMLEQHTPTLSGHAGSATDEHDGQAIRAAQAIGADVGRMDTISGAVHTDPALMVRGILVDEHGNRFINEDTYPGRIAYRLIRNRRSQAYLIADEQAVEEAATHRSLNATIPPPAPNWVSDDTAELEGDSGLPTGALKATLRLYNEHATRGVDPVHHKAAQWVRPLTGPLGVFDLRGAVSGFPTGGLLTDIDGAVLDVDGDPIPGLWAAGRATLGIGATGYASGCSLGDGSFFGRRAGHSAARAARTAS